MRIRSYVDWRENPGMFGDRLAEVVSWRREMELASAAAVGRMRLTSASLAISCRASFIRAPVCKSKARSPVKIVTSSARGPVSRSDEKAPLPRLASFRAVAASIGMSPKYSTRRLTSAILVARQSEPVTTSFHRLASGRDIEKSALATTAPSSLEGPPRPWSRLRGHWRSPSSIIVVRPPPRARPDRERRRRPAARCKCGDLAVDF